MGKKIVTGIIAHVDAGKTTLSESLLFTTGVIKKAGRVDSKDAFLDNDAIERERGITIYSKNARIPLGNNEMILIDTPGHVDFSTETERCLGILDACILLINAAEGVQAHTKTLWSLLKYYNIPTFIFVNKTDMPGVVKENILAQARKELSMNIVDFTDDASKGFFEEIATCDEALLDKFLADGQIGLEDICKAISQRRVFPMLFGSALKMQGIDDFIKKIGKYSEFVENNNSEGEAVCRVYKITRDASGKRITFMKVLSGTLKVKDMLGEEKVNEIRIYSGEKYESVKEAKAGDICAVCGLLNSENKTVYGDVLKNRAFVLAPVLSYAVHYPKDKDRNEMFRILKEIEEEDPSLNVEYREQTKELFVSLMGDVQAEVVKRTLQDRYNIKVELSEGKVCYKETIDAVTIGVGHFEPLRHYAEALIKLEPLERGSGLEFETDVSEDLLDRNWQRLVMTHMCEKEHKGVLLGTPVTDIKMTLVAGKAHIKHTEGGDFRQATYRAIRQGLMKLRSTGNCRLLEPFYDYTLEISSDYVGRAMTDINSMAGTAQISENDVENDITVLTGRAPVSTMNGYMKEVYAYTGGKGRMTLASGGYDICHNEEEVLENSTYNPESDLRNPSSSVFCSHGAGEVISWDEVDDYKHVDYTPETGAFVYINDSEAKAANRARRERELSGNDNFISVEEVDSILKSSTHANENGRKSAYKGMSVAMQERNSSVKKEAKETVYVGTKHKEKYYLVDGYNVIHAWKELENVAMGSLDAAVSSLNDILSNYQAVTKVNLIVVYDAYKVEGHGVEEKKFNDITVVFTKEAQTADQYIERYAHENSKKYDITVVTSDGLEQLIVTGEGCNLLSSREFKTENEQIIKEFNRKFQIESV